MSRNQDLEYQAASALTAAKTDQGESVDPRWEQLLLELSESSSDCPSNLDEIAIARYLSGECSNEERREIEQVIGQSSVLAECVSLAQEVLDAREAAA
jgi:hypothetical protein